MTFLNNFFSQFSKFTEDSIKNIEKSATLKELKKGEIFIHFGKTPSKFYILKSGIVRAIVVDNEGKEYTRSLYTPTAFIAPLSNLINKTPSSLIYDCLTDCVLYEFNYGFFLEFSKKDLSFSNLYSNALEVAYLKMEKRVIELTTLNATERYLNLRKQTPNIDNLIPQYQIASFLNITPVQLSRIRKKLLK